MYRTADLKIYEHWLDAPDCFYPASGDPQSIIVPWTQYCSPNFLEWVNGQYGLADRRTCLVLKHAQFSEYVSVSSANPNADLHRLLLNDSDFKRALVQTIRSKASQSTRRHVTRHFNEVGVKRPRDHFLGSTERLEAGIKRLTCSTSFVVGNNGGARLSSKKNSIDRNVDVKAC